MSLFAVSRLSTRVAADMRSASRRTARLAAVLAAVVLTACSADPTTSTGTPSDPAKETYAAALGVNLAAMTKKSDALYIQDLVVGTGTEAVAGRSLSMVYTGWLVNGTKFDSNVGGSAFSFVLGNGMVITGWDQGVAGMKVGGKRRLVIGSALGYGGQGAGPIPPNATLVFDVELKAVQ